MEGIKGSQGFLSIILSLLSQLLDVPNFTELISHPTAAAKDKSKGYDSSLVKRNVFSDLTLAAKGLFQGSSESSAPDEEIFGKPLPETIPNKLLNVLKFISKYVHLEGLFRVNGSKKRINDLKKIIDTQGNLIDWENQETFTAHDAASLLKLYLSELPEPLLLNRYLAVHMEIAKIMDNESKKIKCLQLLLLLLPENNRMLFKLVVDLLKDVSKNPANLMDAHNLGVVFVPALLKQQDLDDAATCLGGGTPDRLEDLHGYVEFLITNAEFLFDIPDEVQQVSEKFKQRLDSGEEESEIQIDVESKCVKIDTDTAQQIMQHQTRNELMDLYKTFNDMADSKLKERTIKRFQKTYPHIVQEANQQSHSPIIHKKVSLHHSLARMLSKGSFVHTVTLKSHISLSHHKSIGRDTPAKDPILTQANVTQANVTQANELIEITNTESKRSSVVSMSGSPSTPSCSTSRVTYNSLPNLDSPPIRYPSTSTLKAPTTTPTKIGTKRKVLEILQQSPTIPRHYQLQDDTEDMETDMMPLLKKRRNMEPIEMNSRENSDSETDSPMELAYRDLGETGSYREYFV